MITRQHCSADLSVISAPPSLGVPPGLHVVGERTEFFHNCGFTACFSPFTHVACHTCDVSGAFDIVYEKKEKEAAGRGFIIFAEKIPLQGWSTSAVIESPERQSASTLTELLRRDIGVKIELRK